MQSPPEQVARYTVERNGGEYTTDVPDLLELFGRENLTDAARREVRDALQSVDVGTDPDLFVAQRTDAVRLFLLERQRAWSTPASATVPAARTWAVRLLPRSWKGWLVYAFVALLLVGALTEDSPDTDRAVPAGETVDSPAAATTSEDDAATRVTRREARRERARLRRERAERRQERAAARRAKARVRREREEREALLAAEAEAAPEPEPQVESAAGNCHPSYDPCLDPNASDYDCEGGSGDGPMYTGFVKLKGPGDYGLDSDGDGTGCES